MHAKYAAVGGALPPTVHLVGAATETREDETDWPGGGDETHTLWVFAGGAGTATVGESRLAVARSTCLLLPPGSPLRLQPSGGLPLRAYRVSFRVERDESGLFDAPGELIYEPFVQLEEKLEEWLRPPGCGAASGALDVWRSHLRFQTLLCELLAKLQSNATPDEPGQAVERTVDYLRMHYDRDIAIGQLADEANLSRWQFERRFKALTGRTPSGYLTMIRMEQAKRLLADPASRVSEVASRVGYRDEFYFSRRFRQTFGVAPSRYARLGLTGRELPRVFSIQYVGELLALGIRPIGMNRSMRRTFPETCGDDQVVDDDPLDLAQLSRLHPGLIVYPSFLPPPVADGLAQIADAVEVDWEVDVYTRLRRLGNLLGKEKEAEGWIERYNEKAERTKRKLRGCIAPGETAAAFVFHANGLYVYAGHHFGHSLYEGIGFRPPARIQALIDADRNTKWKRIAPEEFAAYAGDRVFFALAESGSDAAEGRKLLKHPAWTSLAAVRQGKSYVTRDAWANYNPITLEKHLDHMAACLQSPGPGIPGSG